MPRCLLLVLLLLAPLALRAAVVGSVLDGRIPCGERDGVQFCEGGLASRIETFDGVPLDVNLTLPPAGMDGPFPLIIDLHGWSLGKTPAPYVAWALAGRVVLSYSARGFHGSCGSPASRAPDASLSNPDVCAERGWIRLADVRYEAHDAQHLAGLLADEGLVVPGKIAVTGASYGGGQSMILAALRNRVMLPDGTLIPWRSPGGLDMTIAAAAPLIPWSDLAYSLTPNGRTLDYRAENPYGRRGGVQKASWNTLLYQAGLLTGFYSTPGVDFASDIQSWNARVGAGEPYDGDPTLEAILAEITAHHSAYYVDDTIAPAPLFIYSAWTDDLFPVDEAVRFWRKTVAKHPAAGIALFFADDFGHARARLGFTGATVIEKVTAFFAHHLDGTGDPPPPVEVTTQACNGAAVEGPFTATDWDALHPGEVRYRSRRPARFAGTGGKPENALATDPVRLSASPCRTVAADDDPAAATYRLPPVSGAGYTLLGSPTVIADLAVTGPNAQVVGRLWDVAGDGMQTLVAHAIYRPRTDGRGPQVFQLHPNAWRFAAGHVPKLELLGQSAPYGRASNGSFTVTVRALELRLPVREAPAGKVVQVPATPVAPPGEMEPPGCDLAPRPLCRGLSSPGNAALTVMTARSGPRLAWRYRDAGAPDPSGLGDPRADTSLRLCLYDGDALVGSALAPAGGTCGRRACWTRTSTGFRYIDRRAATGVRSLGLEVAPGRHTTLTLDARGGHAAVPSMPLAGGPVTAQLVSDAGACWSVTFPTLRRNTIRVLKAVAGGS
jgi:predicted acyl esterase